MHPPTHACTSNASTSVQTSSSAYVSYVMGRLKSSKETSSSTPMSMFVQKPPPDIVMPTNIDKINQYQMPCIRKLCLQHHKHSILVYTKNIMSNIHTQTTADHGQAMAIDQATAGTPWPGHSRPRHGNLTPASLDQPRPGMASPGRLAAGNGWLQPA